MCLIGCLSYLLRLKAIREERRTITRSLLDSLEASCATGRDVAIQRFKVPCTHVVPKMAEDIFYHFLALEDNQLSNTQYQADIT